VYAAIYVVFAVLIVGGIFYFMPRIQATFQTLFGKRVVECPETKAPAGVDVSAGRMALHTLMGKGDLRLKDCSRWPEREGCGQECLAQIAASPSDCLVRSILVRWYEGKECALCGKALTPINWTEHEPAFMDSERRTHEWSETAPEKLQETLAASTAICWNCHVAETFRRTHPGLVIDRPSRPS
jgi:hypothetical protein